MGTQTTFSFGGKLSIPSPEVFQKAKEGNPLWYQLLEKANEAFAKLPGNAGIYPDPAGNGATLEQVWLTHTQFGIVPYCLLAHPLPSEQTGRISRLSEVPPGELVQVLKDIQAKAGLISSVLLYHDGETGHCINLKRYDGAEDRFIYHDPWPEKSLLCLENNPAGIDARPVGGNWSITSGELEKIIFAAMVQPVIWGSLKGWMR